MPAVGAVERLQEVSSPVELAAGVSPAETTLIGVVATVPGAVWASEFVSGEYVNCGDVTAVAPTAALVVGE